MLAKRTITTTVVKQIVTLTMKRSIIGMLKTQTTEIRNDRKSKTVYPSYKTCGKTNHSTENAFLEQMQQIDRLLGIEDR